jgi:hypothetical protein
MGARLYNTRGIAHDQVYRPCRLKLFVVVCAIASFAYPQAGVAEQSTAPPPFKLTATAAPVVFAAASIETALDAIAAS